MNRHTRNTFWGCLLVLAIAGLWSCKAHAQEDLRSGNFFLRHCEHSLADNTVYDVWDGHCDGIVDTLLFFNRNLPPAVRFCSPKTVTRGQAMRVVVSYLNANPARLHEGFKMLAAIALHQAWPCRG